MRKDLITFKPIYSSFLQCDKDIQQILKLLFVESRPYSDLLKRLLLINNKDCLDTSKKDYQQFIDQFTLGRLIEQGYIRLNPKIARGTHEAIKAYILISCNNFKNNSTSIQYRDYNITFDIICYNDAWVLNDFKIRPIMICGYIDGILNSLSNKQQHVDRTHQSQIKLTGMGEYQFLGCDETILNEDFGMYSLAYHGVHFNEDIQQIGAVSR